MVFTKSCRILMTALGACLLLASTGGAQPATPPTGAQQLVASGAQPLKLAEGFRFSEGPARDAKGNMYFTDIPARKILFWDIEAKKLSTFMEESEGANGLMFGPDGLLYAMRQFGRDVVTIDVKTKEVKVILNEFEGKKLNAPNDLWFDAQGGFYFSDPTYGTPRDGMELDGRYVFYVSPDRKKATKVTEALDMPNGLVGTADGKTLYISELGANRILAYEIQPDATLANRRVFHERGSDGMAMDEHGNIYLTGRGRTVGVLNPAGELIADIPFPEGPANCAFGGPENKTLYVTARSGFYSLEMNVKGQ